MYSPKIREDLIPILYRMGQEQQKPMTRVVDEILRGYVTLKEQYAGVGHEGVLETLLHDQSGHDGLRSSRRELSSTAGYASPTKPAV